MGWLCVCVKGRGGSVTDNVLMYGIVLVTVREIHTKHINTLCGQNLELLNVKLAVHIVTTGL